MRLLFTACAVGVALAATGCNNSCYQLAQNICQCQPTSSEISTCNQNISTANSAAEPTNDDLAACNLALNTCDCRSLASGSYEAKVNCLMARANPRDRSLSPSTLADAGY